MPTAIAGFLVVVAICSIGWSLFEIRALFGLGQVVMPMPTAKHPQVVTSTPTPTLTQDETTTVANPQIIHGPWTGQAERLDISVEKVEVVSLIGNQKILRFYLSVNN